MTSGRLTIFEGPDCTGKSTLAKKLAESTNAEYIHFGPLLELDGHQLVRRYTDAINLAVTGRRDVVLDRSWISEKPYGTVCRGVNRLYDIDVYALELLAARCTTVVVNCMTDRTEIINTYNQRLSSEYVKKVDMLHKIIDAYANITTLLPVIKYDYNKLFDVYDIKEYTRPHSTPCTIGHLNGSLAVVVDLGSNSEQIVNCLRSREYDACKVLAALMHFADVNLSDTFWVDASYAVKYPELIYNRDIITTTYSATTLQRVISNQQWRHVRVCPI